MPRHDDIDDQVNRDWEFTRRAEQLMSRLRNQGQATPFAQEQQSASEDGNPPERR